MDLKTRLKELYHKDFNLIHTDLGLSNDIYFIDFKDGTRHVLRMPKVDIDAHVHRNLERAIQVAIKDQGLDFKEIYYDNVAKFRITKYVEQVKTFSECHDSNKYQKVIAMIKTFHNIKLETEVEFELEKKYYGFKSEIKHPLVDYQKYEHVLDDFKGLDEKFVLSHNDLVDGNLLFTNKDSYLIDYEYAGRNHPYFDLMSFITENQINDEDIRKEIYQLYFKKDLDQKLIKCLTIIEAAQNLLWAAWANMLYDSRLKNEYRNIFNDKIQGLERKLK